MSENSQVGTGGRAVRQVASAKAPSYVGENLAGLGAEDEHPRAGGQRWLEAFVKTAL